MAAVTVLHFSDLLCVWAYVGQIKVDTLCASFPDRVRVETRFVPVFGDTTARLAAWSDRGGREGYARHVREVVDRFDHVRLHDGAWRTVAPTGSWPAHAFARAAALAVSGGEIGAGPAEARAPVAELVWRMRLAFFRDARDVGRVETLSAIAEECGLPLDRIRRHLDDGSAMAALAADHDLCARHQIAGSPTFLFNEGRQKLYGNVGYRIVEANVEELLREDTADRASWC